MNNLFKFLKIGQSESNPFIFILLFGLTFVTCMIAGTQWSFHNYLEVTNWHYGITYAVLILTFLSAHEFGHYFAARYHGVRATLPYYIPFPFTFTINFGTFGAVIKTKSPIPSKKALFDIGVAGPLSGFVFAVGFLIYGLMTLPGIEYIYSIHPDYIYHYGGNIPNHGLHFGDTLVYSFLSKIFANPNGFLPPMNEIYHYPFLNVGWFGLFVTTLNMLPMGQLDGGHITYSMFGEKNHLKIAKIVYKILLVIGFGAMLGAVHDSLKLIPADSSWIIFKEMLYPSLDWLDQRFPIVMNGWAGWLVWAFISKFFLKLQHPPVYDDTPLDARRKILGWISLIVLLLSFSYTGIYIIE